LLLRASRERDSFSSGDESPRRARIFTMLNTILANRGMKPPFYILKSFDIDDVQSFEAHLFRNLLAVDQES
jgi:hypothetical protein